MNKEPYIAILMTASSEEEARGIAKALVEEKRVACVNVVPKVLSFYWWEGKVCREEEVLLIAKSRAPLFPEIVDRVKELHSYQVPEIIAIPLSAGSGDYLRWIDEVTRATGS